MIATKPGAEPAVEPWHETVTAVGAITKLVRNAAGAATADYLGLFAENVELDLPLERRMEFLQQGLGSVGAVGAAEGMPEFERPSCARWTLLAEHGTMELEIELMPVAPFAVQTFSATMVRGGGRVKLF